MAADGAGFRHRPGDAATSVGATGAPTSGGGVRIAAEATASETGLTADETTFEAFFFDMWHDLSLTERGTGSDPPLFVFVFRRPN